MSPLDGLPTLLVVDDDEIFAQTLSRAMIKRGFSVMTANNAGDATRLASASPPDYAVIDLKMPGESGLSLIRILKEFSSSTTIVVLTGYASIATAVEAIKLGATSYLAKPANADEILQALHSGEGDDLIPMANSPLSVDRMEWEHIQRVLSENQGNISATARSLNMHRRTLQRKLLKRPAKS
ncbi:response regulator transcription factor [Methyloradius palustris]|nr:response regulator transcription factor [Methyloradius palustris]